MEDCFHQMRKPVVSCWCGRAVGKSEAVLVTWAGLSSASRGESSSFTMLTWPFMCYPWAGGAVDSAASPHTGWLCSRINIAIYSLLQLRASQALCCPRISRSSWNHRVPLVLLCHCSRQAVVVFPHIGNAFSLEYSAENIGKVCMSYKLYLILIIDDSCRPKASS